MLYAIVRAWWIRHVAAAGRPGRPARTLVPCLGVEPGRARTALLQVMHT